MWASLVAGLLARPWARRMTAIFLLALTIALFILNLRRTAKSPERTFCRAQITHASDRCAAVNLTMQTESDRTGLFVSLT